MWSFRVIALFIPLVCSLPIFANSLGNAEPKKKAFDSHNLSGVWWVKDPDPQRILERGKLGDASKCQTCHFSLHANVPEPLLTAWGKEHLTIPNEISADAGVTMVPARSTNCDPIGLPSQFWYAQFAPFEIVNAPGRIVQFFENHREWRPIWMDRQHSKSLAPTYMGDSVGSWKKNVLVVDTIGFNGKNLIEPVGVNHVMSNSFHLIEHWSRIGNDTIELKAIYYDSKAWGTSRGPASTWNLYDSMIFNWTRDIVL